MPRSKQKKIARDMKYSFEHILIRIILYHFRWKKNNIIAYRIMHIAKYIFIKKNVSEQVQQTFTNGSERYIDRFDIVNNVT